MGTFAGKTPVFLVQPTVMTPVPPTSASRLEVRLPDRLSERLESLASS
jgi:hypothetical protein